MTPRHHSWLCARLLVRPSASLVRVLFAAFFVCLPLLPAHAALNWDDLPPLPEAISGHATGVLGETVVVIGGSSFPVSPFQGGAKQWHSAVYWLPLGADAWEHAGDLPEPRAYGVAAQGTDAIHVVGGDSGERLLDSVVTLRLENARLVIEESLPALPTPLAYGGGALVGTRIILVGGQTTRIATEAIGGGWSMDLATEVLAWEQLEGPPAPARILPAAAAHGGQLYLIGGAVLSANVAGRPSRTYLDDAWRYAPGMDWEALPPLPHALAAAAAAPLGGSHILVFGGDDGSLFEQTPSLGDAHPGFLDTVLAFHTITNTWASLGTFPMATVTTNGVTRGGQVIVAGGEDRPGHRIPRVMVGSPGRDRDGFGMVDYGTLVLYLAALISMGLYFARREKSTESFFLGGRRMPWWAVGISIFGTSLSAITYLAIPARAYATDWVWAFANMGILFVAPFIVAFYIPRYREMPITTAYEFLERRFNLLIRIYGSICFLIFQIGRVSIVTCLPAIALSTATGLDVYLCIIAMGLLATVYTVLGGIEAVIWTDVLQALVLTTGAVVALGLIIWNVDGGATAIVANARAADKLHAANWTWDWTIPALWVVLLGNALSNLYPATADQTVVQRYLSTADVKTARRAVWTNALLTIPITLLFFSLGTALWAYYQQHPEQLDPTLQNDAILPLFVVQQFPIGLKGILIAGVFAAAMSSLDSSMNSVSSVLVTDYYRRFVKGVTDRQALLAAKGVTLGFGLLGTGFAMVAVGLDATSLWDPFLMVLNWAGGGLSGVMALAVFSRRANGVGAVCGAVASVGAIYWVQFHTGIHFFLHGGFGFAAALVVGYVVSRIIPGRSGAASAPPV